MVYSTGKRQKTVAKGRLLCETKNRYNRVIIELSFFLTTSDCNCNCSQVNWKNGAIFVSRVTLIETQQNQCHWINWREREKARKNNKLLVFSLEKSIFHFCEPYNTDTLWQWHLLTFFQSDFSFLIFHVDKGAVVSFVLIKHDQYKFIINTTVSHASF